MATFGRKQIFTNYTYIDESNIVDVLTASYQAHLNNATSILHLFNYYRGNQDILNRVKKIRSDHNAKIVENHAYEIANFIAGYLLAKPIQYVAKNKDIKVDKLSLFNDYLLDNSKESQDITLAKNRSICGTGYRIALPLDEDLPFECYVLPSDSTFVVYGTTIGNKAMLGCTYYKEKIDNKDQIILEAYTEDMYFKVNMTTQRIIDSVPHSIGYIPIIEYPLNEERIGSFEIVETMLDAINLIDSDSVNALTQFVQSLMVFKNIDITKEQLEQLKDMGAINISDNGEVEANIEYITQELNQSQTQALKDSMVQTAYKIVGMPVSNSGAGGDSGVAVIYKDGWTEVEAKMRPNELSFKDSERKFLKLVLSLTKTMTRNKIDLSAKDIEIKFTRSNYENIAQRVDAFTKMMSLDKVAPILAYQTSGLFSDPEQACLTSEKYVKENTEKEVANNVPKNPMEEVNNNDTETIRD